MNETILSELPDNLSENKISVGKNTVSHLKLPCAAISVTLDLKNNNVEVKIGPSPKNIKFYPKDDFSEFAKFKVNCGRRFFKIVLVHSKHFLTLYQPSSSPMG